MKTRHKYVVAFAVVVLALLTLCKSKGYRTSCNHDNIIPRTAVESWEYNLDDDTVDEGGYTTTTGTIVHRYGSILSNSDTMSMHTLNDIVTNSDAIAVFLKRHGVPFDSVWIPTETHIAAVKPAFIDYLSKETSNAVGRRAICRFRYLKNNLTNWIPQYAGFSNNGHKSILCCMYARVSGSLVVVVLYNGHEITDMSWNEAL